MKNTFFTLFLLISFFGLFAQNQEVDSIPKNYIGINFSGNYSKLTINKITSSQLSVSGTPYYGLRVKNFVLGTGISFGYIFNKTPNNYNSNNLLDDNKTEKIFTLTLIPTIRHYSKYNFFITASFFAGKGKREEITPYQDNTAPGYTVIATITRSYTVNIIGGDLGIGYAIKAGKSFLIEPTFSFQKMKMNFEYNENFNVSYTNYLSSINSRNYIYSESKDYSIFNFGIGTTYRF
jgi:uncharacterized membrane protein